MPLKKLDQKFFMVSLKEYKGNIRVIVAPQIADPGEQITVQVECENQSPVSIGVELRLHDVDVDEILDTYTSTVDQGVFTGNLSFIMPARSFHGKVEFWGGVETAMGLLDQRNFVTQLEAVGVEWNWLVIAMPLAVGVGFLMLSTRR